MGQELPKVWSILGLSWVWKTRVHTRLHFSAFVTCPGPQPERSSADAGVRKGLVPDVSHSHTFSGFPLP